MVQWPMHGFAASRGASRRLRPGGVAEPRGRGGYWARTMTASMSSTIKASDIVWSAS